MRIADESKSGLGSMYFRELKPGDVFWYNGSARMKLNSVIQHVHVYIGTDREDVALEIMDYDSVCLSDGTPCKHEPETVVYWQPQATVYLKG